MAVHDAPHIRPRAVEGAVDDEAGLVHAKDVPHNARVDDITVLSDGQQAARSDLIICKHI